MAAKTLALNMVMNTDQFRRDVKVAQDAIRDLSTQTEKAKQIAGNFKLAGFDTSQLSNMKSQFETTGKLQDRFFAATHTGLQTTLKKHSDYFSDLRTKWQSNESMLTMINKTETAERSKIMTDYGQKTQSTMGGLYSLYSKYLTVAFVAYGAVKALKSVTSAAMEEQAAESKLQAAIGGNITSYKRYADQLSNQTIYGDERIMQEMAYAKNLGVTSDQLNSVTKAAIGLSSKYQIDLTSAIKIVSKASQGYFNQLSKVGIIINKDFTSQEKYNEILRIGSEAFKLAEAQTNTAAGAFAQWENASHNLKAALGDSLLPTLTAVAKEATKVASSMTGEKKPSWLVGLSPLASGFTINNLNKKLKQSTSIDTTSIDIKKEIEKAAQDDYRKMTGEMDAFTSKRIVTKGDVWDIPVQPKNLEAYNKLLNDYVQAESESQRIIFEAEKVLNPTVNTEGAEAPVTNEMRQSYIKMYNDLGIEGAKYNQYQSDLLDDQVDEFRAAGVDEVDAARWKSEQLNKISKEVVNVTRDALTQMRSMDYLTRNERIMNLEAYKATHADVMTDVVGKETEAGKILREEINNLKNSRQDAMKVYQAELRDDMQNSALYTSEKYAEAARAIEGSMSNAFNVMENRSASASERIAGFIENVASSMSRVYSDMAARGLMNLAMNLFTPAPTGMATTGAQGAHVFHSGGMGYENTRVEMAPVSLLAKAPSLHMGSDEMYAKIRKKEGVFTEEQMKNLGPAGGGGKAPSVIVNNNTGQKFEQDGPPRYDGEKWVVSIVAKNIKENGSLRKLVKG